MEKRKYLVSLLVGLLYACSPTIRNPIGPNPQPVPIAPTLTPNPLDWDHSEDPYELFLLRGAVDYLPRSRFYDEVSLFRQCVDILRADDGRMVPDLLREGESSYLHVPYIPYRQEPIRLGVHTALFTGRYSTGKAPVYQIFNVAEITGEIGHELAHCAQQLKLLETVRAIPKFSEEQKEKEYYRLRNKAVDVGIWELEATFVQMAILWEAEVEGANRWENPDWPLGSGIKGSLAEDYLALVASGLNWWESDEFLARVTQEWDQSTVDRLKSLLPEYEPMFR